MKPPKNNRAAPGQGPCGGFTAHNGVKPTSEAGGNVISQAARLGEIFTSNKLGLKKNDRYPAIDLDIVLIETSLPKFNFQILFRSINSNLRTLN